MLSTSPTLSRLPVNGTGNNKSPLRSIAEMSQFTVRSDLGIDLILRLTMVELGIDVYLLGSYCGVAFTSLSIVACVLDSSVIYDVEFSGQINVLRKNKEHPYLKI